MSRARENGEGIGRQSMQRRNAPTVATVTAADEPKPMVVGKLRRHARGSSRLQPLAARPPLDGQDETEF
jgi:hypothetical protein